MKITRIVLLGIVVGILAGLGISSHPAPQAQEFVQAKVKHARGYKKSKNLAALKKASYAKHGAMLKWLPKILAPQYDTSTLGIDPPVIDQGQCGSCWDFSGVEVCTAAFLKAGYGKPDGSFYLSPQYVLDCGRNGGCSGDDNVTVLEQCKATGLVTTADYGAYQGGPGRCKSTTGMTVYKISDWGFCSTSDNQGVASVQDIKNAMVAFGPIGSGVDASQFDNYTNGVLSGAGSNIDHDILLVGWDDTKGRAGAWKLQNSWNTTWGINGYMWIEYGAFDVGTEAVWATATPLPVPPVPPTPVPPVPPGPGPSTTMTWTVNGSGTWLDGQTWELAKTGTQTFLAGASALQTMPPAPTPTPTPTTLEARVTAIEQSQADIKAGMDKLLKILEGK